MEFRHLFVRNKYADKIYMQGIRPLGFLLFLYPVEAVLNYYCRKRYSYLTQFKGIHKGKRCFIIGTGPSLKKEDIILIKNEKLMGVNGLCLWREFVPYIDYFFIDDIHAYRRLFNFLPENTFVSSYCKRKCSDLERNRFNEIPISRYNYFCTYHKRFSTDISVISYDFNSVIFLAIQFAIYAGFKEIYLLGVDCNYNTDKIYAVDHGIKHEKTYMQNVGLDMIKNFEFIQKYIEKKKIPVSIYNASPGGMLEVFPRVSLSKVVNR